MGILEKGHNILHLQLLTCNFERVYNMCDLSSKWQLKFIFDLNKVSLALAHSLAMCVVYKRGKTVKWIGKLQDVFAPNCAKKCHGKLPPLDQKQQRDNSHIAWQDSILFFRFLAAARKWHLSWPLFYSLDDFQLNWRVANRLFTKITHLQIFCNPKMGSLGKTVKNEVNYASSQL